MTSDSFQNRVAIVTGGSRGIGFSIAWELVQRGAKVCLTGRNQEVLERAAADLSHTQSTVYVRGKVDDPAHQDETIAHTLDTFGRIDMLVNNVGINPVFGPVTQLEPRTAEKIMRVNLLAPLFWTSKVCAAWMGEHGGSVVNIASIAAESTSPGAGLYGVSKAALVRLTKELAIELAPAIRVNAVLPGVVRTRMSASVLHDRESELATTYPLKRLGEPVDVAAAVTYLLSDSAGWTTGSALVVDGGALLQAVL